MKLLSDKDYKKLKESKRFEQHEVTIFGTKIIIPDAPSFFFFIKEFFELEIYKFKTDSQNPLIIDCGANMGMSIIYFKKLYPNCKIIAFEPDESIFKVLSHNLNSFNLNNITLINKALWHTETTLDFYVEGGDGGRISTKYDKNNIINIKTDILSNYLKTKIDFLKIDIEGSETVVLEESQHLLINVKNIFIEYHSKTGYPQDLSVVLSILEKCGFRYYITHTCHNSNSPLIKINNNGIFDNQLHIFGYREAIDL